MIFIYDIYFLILFFYKIIFYLLSLLTLINRLIKSIGGGTFEILLIKFFRRQSFIPESSFIKNLTTGRSSLVIRLPFFFLHQ